MTKHTFCGKMAPVIDLDYDLSCALHTPEVLKEKIRLLAELGFKRIYIVSPPPDEPDYSHAVRMNVYPPEKNNNLAQSRQNLPNAMRQAIRMAKEANLEVFAVFKPYEGGGTFTVPRGHHPVPARPTLACIGGVTGVSSFLAEHPDVRVKRKPLPEQRGPVTELEFVFLLDELTLSTGDSRIPVRHYQAVNEAELHSMIPPQIFTSEDNGTYQAQKFNLKVETRIEHRTLLDANGGRVFPSASRCLVVALSGLRLEQPFFAVKFKGKAKFFRTIPFSMIKAFFQGKPVDVTVSPTVRNVPDMTREYALKPPMPGDFQDCGFEFEEVGPYYWDAGWRETQLFGLARGREPYVRGSACEACEKVRTYWLEQIQRLVEMGCDGIDIRLMSHCSGITDFTNYGFNRELVEAYQEKHGVDMRLESPDPIKLMKLRGDFFLQFVQQTKELLLEHQVKLQLHLRNCMINPTLEPTFPYAGFWAMPKVIPDWRRMVELADEISIKDYSFNHYLPQNAIEIKKYAMKRHKPLWIHCYLQQGNELNSTFLNAVAKDKFVSGILLYEVVFNVRENDGLIEVTNSGLVRLVEKHRSLLQTHLLSNTTPTSS